MSKNKNLCFCHSEKEFKYCCEPFLTSKQLPATPEQLMRSRYTAFCLLKLDYVQKTMQGKALQNFNLRESLSNTKKCKWISLKVISTSRDETTGFVEFIAGYSSFGKIHYHHEKSEFELVNGKWFYIDGIFL